MDGAELLDRHDRAAERHLRAQRRTRAAVRAEGRAPLDERDGADVHRVDSKAAANRHAVRLRPHERADPVRVRAEAADLLERPGRVLDGGPRAREEARTTGGRLRDAHARLRADARAASSARERRQEVDRAEAPARASATTSRSATRRTGSCRSTADAGSAQLGLGDAHLRRRRDLAAAADLALAGREPRDRDTRCDARVRARGRLRPLLHGLGRGPGRSPRRSRSRRARSRSRRRTREDLRQAGARRRRRAGAVQARNPTTGGWGGRQTDGVGDGHVHDLDALSSTSQLVAQWRGDADTTATARPRHDDHEEAEEEEVGVGLRGLARRDGRGDPVQQVPRVGRRGGGSRPRRRHASGPATSSTTTSPRSTPAACSRRARRLPAARSSARSRSTWARSRRSRRARRSSTARSPGARSRPTARSTGTPRR